MSNELENTVSRVYKAVEANIAASEQLRLESREQNFEIQRLRLDLEELKQDIKENTSIIKGSGTNAHSLITQVALLRQEFNKLEEDLKARYSTKVLWALAIFGVLGSIIASIIAAIL